MVTIYAWLEIRATYLDEDLHPEIDEKKVFTEYYFIFDDYISNQCNKYLYKLRKK